jgi:dTDP-4-dehydrorhamnose 3,5-epimerase
MTFTELNIPGVWLVKDDVFHDERGTFARVWVPDEFRAHGLETAVAQGSLARNRTRGTIRGLHFQAPPHQEVKLIRAVHGAIFDVAVDLRPDSPTFQQWVGIELTADSQQWVYLPRGIAHGYQTLTPDADVFYFVSAPYMPSHQRGVRWNDPAFAVNWPLGHPTVINERDATYPDFVAPVPAGSWPTPPNHA